MSHILWLVLYGDFIKVIKVGRTGAGKSSLLSALFRINNGLSGELFVDGLPTSTTHLKQLRQKISIIPQDPVIFSDDVRANLGFRFSSIIYDLILNLIVLRSISTVFRWRTLECTETSWARWLHFIYWEKVRTYIGRTRPKFLCWSKTTDLPSKSAFEKEQDTRYWWSNCERRSKVFYKPSYRQYPLRHYSVQYQIFFSERIHWFKKLYELNSKAVLLLR